MHQSGSLAFQAGNFLNFGTFQYRYVQAFFFSKGLCYAVRSILKTHIAQIVCRTVMIA